MPIAWRSARPNKALNFEYCNKAALMNQFFLVLITRLEGGEVVLVAIYAKAKFDNMPASVLKLWKEAYDA